MEREFLIGIIRARLFYRGCRTLKERRGLLASLKARMTGAGFQIIQTGDADNVKFARIAAVCISGDGRAVARKMEKAANMLHDPRWELSEHETDIIGSNQLSHDRESE